MGANKNPRRGRVRRQRIAVYAALIVVALLAGYCATTSLDGGGRTGAPSGVSNAP